MGRQKGSRREKRGAGKCGSRESGEGQLQEGHCSLPGQVWPTVREKGLTLEWLGWPESESREDRLKRWGVQAALKRQW